MKLLAIDSSGLVASVAILSDDTIVAEYTTNFKKTHSQTLLPMLNEMIEMTGIELSDIDGIAVAAGPGSFTGLRIGSATAKGLGLALKKPIISVPTVDGLAYNLFGTNQLICPIMDAKRGQVYTGLYEFRNNVFHVLSEQKAVAIEEIIEEIKTYKRSVVFLGDGVEVHRDKVRDELGHYANFAPAHLSKQRAASIAVLASTYEMGCYETAMEHQPVYLRLSQAERELSLKQQKEQNHVAK